MVNNTSFHHPDRGRVLVPWVGTGPGQRYFSVYVLERSVAVGSS